MSGRRFRWSALTHDARVLLIGVGCVGIILLASKGVPAWMRWRAGMRDALAGAELRVTERKRLLHASQGAIGSLDRRENALLGLSPAVLKGASASQGAAVLASILADAGEANGVQLSSLQPDADSASTTAIVPVTVRASGSGDVRGITGMLRDLESDVPLIDVRQLTIGQSDPTAPHDRMEALHIELTIRALYRRLPADTDPTDTQ